MLIKVRAGMGSIVGNFIRQIALTQLPSTKVIGYKVGDYSTVVDTKANVIEDMTEIGNNLCSCQYEMDTEFKTVIIQKSGVISAQDMAAKTDQLKVYGNKDILHSTSGDITLVVYLRKSNNYATEEQNREFLLKHHVKLENTVVLTTRFSDLEFVGFTINTAGEFDEVSLFFKSKLPTETEEAIHKLITQVITETFLN